MSPGQGPRLILDVQALQSIDHGERGIARYVSQHAGALVARGAVAGALLSPALPPPRQLPDELLDGELLHWNSTEAYRRLAAQGPVAYHVMSPFEFAPPTQWALPPHAMRSGDPIVATLYDLIPLVLPDIYLRDAGHSARYHARLAVIRSAELVLAISESTRRDAIDRLALAEDRVVNIGAGISPFFRPPGPADTPELHVRGAVPQITRPFVLDVAGADPRKNVEALIDAYARLPRGTRRDLQLVVTCHAPPAFRAQWTRHARSAGLADGEMVLTGYVSDDVLRALYQTARVSVFPSIYEGFGLPVGEAVACGCPTITSDTAALSEVLDWPDATFPAADVEAMNTVLRRSLDDRGYRDDLRRRGAERVAELTWEAVAARTIGALRAMPPPRGTNHRSHKLRVALVTPFPPAQTGIAKVSAGVAACLESLCELTVLQTERRPAAADLASRFPARALGTRLNPAAYDAIVYAMGNSPDHHDTLELATRFPGILWLHDVRLSGLYRTYADRRPGGEDEFRTQCVERMYLSHLPELLSDQRQRFDGAYGARGLLFSRELVAASRAVVVHSAVAERMVSVDQGAYGRTPPIRRLFLPFPPVDHPPAAADRREPPAIVCFGHVGEAKYPEALIRAAAPLHDRTGGRVVFAGPVWHEDERALMRLAREIGAADCVMFTGDLTDADYTRWLRRASCAVQLRAVSNGESSATIRDCLSAGVPVVTNMVGAAEELGAAVFPLRPSATIDDLVDAVANVLGDEARRTAARDAGYRLAAEQSSEQFAHRLLAVLSEICESPAG